MKRNKKALIQSSRIQFVFFILLFSFFSGPGPNGISGEETLTTNPPTIPEEKEEEKSPEEKLKELNEKMDVLLEEMEIYRERARQRESLRQSLGVQEKSLLDERNSEKERAKILENRLKEEREERQKLEQEKELLQGNLVSPGYGHLVQGRSIRGITWIGFFLGSLVATAASYSHQEHLHRSMVKNAFNPYELPRAQKRYDRAYRKTLLLGGLTVGIYGAGVMDAILERGGPRNTSSVTGLSDSTLQLSFQIRF